MLRRQCFKKETTRIIIKILKYAYLVLGNYSRKTFGCPTLILSLGVVSHFDNEEQIGVCVEAVRDCFSVKYNFFHGVFAQGE